MFVTAFHHLLANMGAGIIDWIVRFLYFWFVGGPKMYWRRAFSLIMGFEDIWAVGITLRNLFSPLYQDYTISGRIIGPFFRLARVLIGSAVILFMLALETYIFLILCIALWGAPLLFLINLFIWNQ